MNIRTLEKLDFKNIIDLHKHYINTIYGRERLSNIEFFKDKKQLEEELFLVDEILAFIISGKKLDIYGFPDIRNSIGLLKGGFTLEVPDAFDFFNFLCSADRLIKNINRIDTPIFSSRFRTNFTFTTLVSEVEKIFTSDGQISDKASARLEKTRKEIKNLTLSFDSILNSSVNKYKDSLVSDNYIIKDNRYLLPVKTNRIKSVNGIIAGYSDSGHTIFIEPIEIVEYNNKFYELKAEEEDEISRILFVICEKYRASLENINWFIEKLGYLDFSYGKALCAFDKKFSRIEISDEKNFRLIQFYHPSLLNPVKNNLEFGGDKNFVIITGPNTGGKSVLLKAVGIIQLLFQAGFFTPTSIGSSLPIMDDILVDIGDLQSIEESLSTFSSHILTINEILSKANNKTLVLIDELGTATSPLEGEALAISILQHLIQKKAYGIITSHFDNLKVFAMQNENTLIGSMGFDEKQLVPRYILMMNIPGSSYAFDIAKKLGLPDDIISNAKNLVSFNKESDTVIKKLSQLYLELKEKMEIIENKEYELSKRESEIKILKEKYDKTERTIRKEFEQEFQEKFKQFRKEIEQEIASLKKEGYQKDSSKNIASMMDKYKESLEGNAGTFDNSGYNRDVENMEKKNYIDSSRINSSINMQSSLKIGDRVDVKLFGKKGVITEIGDKKAKVKIDNFIFEIPIFDLIKIREKEESKSQKTDNSYVPAKNIPMTLDIRGKSVAEAEEILNEYFNQLALTNHKKVYIIHGKGLGILSEFVHDYLKNIKIVDSFSFAKPEEGGTGCTIVILKN